MKKKAEFDQKYLKYLGYKEYFTKKAIKDIHL